jgi:hypothetical protein
MAGLLDCVIEPFGPGTKTAHQEEVPMRYARIGLIALAAFGLIAGVACDDDTRDDLKDAAEEAKEKAAEGGARVVAEGYRASIKAQDTDDASGGVRNMEALRVAASDLPGDPEVTGIEDADGDGRDDDGYVQVTVEDENACVTLPESGDDIEVSGGACPTG